MRVALVFAVAAAAYAGARVARTAANDDRPSDLVETPYAPTAGTAPFVSLGYREAAADLLWVRLTGYFGGDRNTSQSVGELVDAIITLDPQFYRVYEWGARAITLAHYGVDQASYLHAIAILERAARAYPDDYRFPYLEGQIYAQDLVTTDPAQRRAWDERATSLVQSAAFKPGAPSQAATYVATMQTKLGQHRAAVEGLEALILTTSDGAAQQRLLEQLAALEDRDAAAVRAEVLEARRTFERAWQRVRPEVPPTMYVLLGGRLPPAFDLGDIATGGRDLDVAQVPVPVPVPADGSDGSDGDEVP